MRIKSLIAILLLIFAAVACIDEYWPEMGKYENLLVVDGLITDDPGPYYIRLSLTSSVNDPELIPLQGCRVTLTDNTGNSEQLMEMEPGTYATAADGIQGVVGRKYQLSIFTPEGKTYVSPYEEMPSSVGIDTVYAELEYQPWPESYHDRVGYQFYLDTYRAETDTNYYLWQLEETYEYHSDFYIDYYFDGRIHDFYNRDSVYSCWKTENVYEIFTATTIDFTQPLLTRFPLHYVDTQTKKLTVRYSLLVKQLTVNTDAFAFWSSIQELITDDGSLYDKQPYQITGNVISTSGDIAPVLGYFTVAGLARKRIFVDKPASVPFYYDVCELTTNLMFLGMASKSEYPIYLTRNTEGRLGFASDACFDCTMFEGSLTPPDFWVSK